MGFSKVKKYIRIRLLISSIAFSTFFTFLLVLGGVVYDRDSLPTWGYLKDSGKNFYFSPLIFLMVCIFIYFILFLLDSRYLNERDLLPQHHCIVNNAFSPATLFFLMYGVVYLSFYPGTWCYDIVEQNKMVLGLVEFTKHHPPLHTYLWGCCLLVERLTQGNILGIVFYSFLQITVTSAINGKVVYVIRKITKNDVCAIITFLYFLFNPTFALFSFSPTKDPWCSLFFLLAMTFLFEIIYGDIDSAEKDTNIVGEKNTKYGVIAWFKVSVCLLLSCLFRNNMVYGLLLGAIILLIVFRNKWRTILFVAISVFGIYLLINNGLYAVLGIADVENKEMLSVPLQQIGRTYEDYGESFTEEEIHDVDRYIGLDMIVGYNPHISDPLKFKFHSSEFNSDKFGFFSLWLELGKKYPDSYLIAYLSQYCPYWYIRSKSYDVYFGSPYVETDISEDTDYLFSRKGYLPHVYEFYKSISSKSDSLLLSRGVPFWTCLTTVFFAVVLRKKKAFVIPVLCFSYMVTLFLGPVCIIRYALPVLSCSPLMVLSLMMKTPSSNKN